MIQKVLHVSIIVLNAPVAKLVQTLPNVPGVVVHRGTNLAKESRVLDLFE